MALVPEAIAFSFIAGVNPLVGLWAAVFMGFITASTGGRPGMISGATGAIAVVVFAWESAKHVRLRRDDSQEGVRIYNLQGVLYFESVRGFAERLIPSNDPDEVIIDFKQARVADFSSLEALNTLTERYWAAGKRVRLRHLSPACAKMIDSASSLVTVEVADDDPHYVPENF